MKMALQGNTLRIKDADNVQFTVIKSWNKMRWVKKLQELQGTADLASPVWSGSPRTLTGDGRSLERYRTPWTGSGERNTRPPFSSFP